MTWFITNLIAALLLPPLNLLLLMAVGAMVIKRRPKLGRGLLVGGFALLWISSTPYFAEGAMHLLEDEVAPLAKQSADAIVILGGGSYFQAPEYAHQDTVSNSTLPRVRYGAALYRATDKPILVTGGSPLGNNTSEAQQMRAVLEQEFHVPVRWMEDKSNNTLENARFSFKMLQQADIKRIYLVSHAWHLPRAIRVFQQAGFEVVPAPTAFTTRYRTDLFAFLPDSEAMQHSRIFAHEMIGLIWYSLKARTS